MKFHQLELDPRILSAVDDLNFTHCTPVQEATFSHTLAGRDVYVQSRTGTGKTAAFLITIYQLFLTGNLERRRALIIAPTRELAVQIEQDAKKLGTYLPFSMGTFHGGVGYKAQEEMLKNKVDLIIGTPGRILDLANSRNLSFKDMGIIVIDEADRLFDMGFYPDIRKVFRKALPPTERMTMLFSATLSTRVRHLAWEFMNNPAEVAVTPEKITVDEISQVLYHVSAEEKTNLLLGILAKEKPGSTLIFTNTKQMAVELSKRLKANGYKNRYIMGDLHQSKRLSVINTMKAGNLDILVATDVAARGLHIEDLDLVVNYDLPDDCENYVHRIGRTARAGKAGKAVSLVCERYVYNLPAIESFIGMKIPVEWPDPSMFVEDNSANLNLDAERYARRTDAKRRRKSVPTPRTGKTPRGGAGTHRPGKERTPSAREPDREARRPPGSDSSIEERLEYYRKKYGEDFQLKEKGEPNRWHSDKDGGKDTHDQRVDKRKAFGKIASIFRRK